MAIRTVSIEPGDGSDEDEIRVGVHTAASDQMLATLERLRLTKGVRSAAIRG